MIGFTDHLFTTSIFNKPLVLKDKPAILVLVTRLILMDEGTISHCPEAGVGLVKKYRYMDQDVLPELRVNIKEQIERFLPYFNTVDVDISMDENKILYINLSLDDNYFVLKSRVTKNNEITLDNLID